MVKIRNMVLCALFAALLCICAWIAVPAGDVFLTLQTFGIFLTLGLLGGKRGTAAIGVYLLLGAVGLPVFSGFRGGLGVLLGASGGYLFGFLAAGLVFWLVSACLSESRLDLPVASIAGLLALYATGTVWFAIVYVPPGTSLGLLAILVKYVFPYLIPDGLKLGLALLLTRKLKPFV